ncbi:MAG TPA: VOC family protein [Candidatus Dormibacteraeota bacterium]
MGCELDHLIYGVGDLELAISDLVGRTGVRPTRGGRHLGRGTANALLGLGMSRYLELLGPDPEAADWVPLAYGLDQLAEPKLVGWAVRTEEIERSAELMREQGWDPGRIEEMERIRPDGVRLRWRLTLLPMEEVGAYPFLIDWGDSPHPSETAPSGLELAELRLDDPEPDRLRKVLESLGVSAVVAGAEEPSLTAHIRTAAGPLVLR